MIKKVYGFCVCTGNNPHTFGTSKVLAIKKSSFIVIFFMHYLSHIPLGKGACDLGEGVPSNTLSTKAWSPSPAPRQKFQDPPLNIAFDVARKVMKACKLAPRRSVHFFS